MSETQQPQLANLCLVTDREGNIDETFVFITNSPEETKEIVDSMRPERAGKSRTIFTNIVPSQINGMIAGGTRIFDIAQLYVGDLKTCLTPVPLSSEIEKD